MWAFLKLGAITATSPIMAAIQFSKLWEGNEIHLRDYEKGFLPAWGELAVLQEHVWNLMRGVQAVRLGDVLIERIPTGTATKIKGEGLMRHEIVLQAGPGCLMRMGKEGIGPETGDVWAWKVLEAAERINESADDWISLIIELER